VTEVEFRLLGAMELRIGDAPAKLPGAAERGLLAVLLLSPGRTVAATSLVDRLWSESALPADPLNALQVRVSKLRRALAAHDLDIVVRESSGYRADVDEGQVDVHCFVTRMRQRAAESDLVIVNHHLLCADAAVRQNAYGEVIPSCAYAIVDEAHQLEDVATQYFGISVSNYRLDDLARDVDKAVGAHLIPDAAHADGVRDTVDRLRDRARRFFGALQMIRFEGPGAGVESRVQSDDVRATATRL
jgi:hypothetical protein